MSDPHSVRYEVTGRVARLTLSRPDRGNGITLGLVRELSDCVERADLDPAVHVLLLAGDGPGFCAGYDLVESAERMGAAGERDARRGEGESRPGEADARPEHLVRFRLLRQDHIAGELLAHDAVGTPSVLLTAGAGSPACPGACYF